MCGINGILSNFFDQNNQTNSNRRNELVTKLNVMNKLIKHRGPDGDGVWVSNNSTKNNIGLGHVRLSIIDLSTAANQPLLDQQGNVLVFNGEIYNYLELKQRLKAHWQFSTESDTEVILAAYNFYGQDFLKHLDGMFAFALWDNKQQKLILARDRIGIKNVYYYQDHTGFYFSSEVKALLPFIDNLRINPNGLTEYLLFQYPLKEELIYDQIKQLLPAQVLEIQNNKIQTKIYWELKYTDLYSNPKLARSNFVDLMQNVSAKHVLSDVPIGAYLSGGVDSSLVTLLAKKHSEKFTLAVNGKFIMPEDTGFDESFYAHQVAEAGNLKLDSIDITADDFINNISKIIYHLDFPVAGPGAFPQYMVSQTASKYVKVMLGGQGGDELFGGYARYLMIYFEQVVRHALDGDLNNSLLKPDPSKILSQLGMLREYKPLYKQFMAQDCFADYARRYYDLINKASNYNPQEINWNNLPVAEIYSKYNNIFESANLEQDYLLNKVLHFDFKCLLPALLHVEDRVSMAHGIESRVPLLDHRVVEFAANLTPALKFTNGEMKAFIKSCYGNLIPKEILNRKDKMGFPVPLNQWLQQSQNNTNKLKEFIIDTLSTTASKNRDFINYNFLLNNLSENTGFSRKLWGMLSLELWCQNFIDKHSDYKKLICQHYENINIV
ncbi:MAG: asparagine synthase (glutamine-hydrolyzing) [Gammaproteobacteria bacterium]|nr:asparagine synthase (glutamine-hydrolyzing) [Gammaproteobacteria bacterium]